MTKPIETRKGRKNQTLPPSKLFGTAELGLKPAESTVKLVEPEDVQTRTGGMPAESQESGPTIWIPGMSDIAAAPPHDRASLAAWVKRRFGMTVPDRAVCPGHSSPMDYLEASFLGQQDLLVWANRGGGKTYLAAIATVMDALFRGPMKICVLGGSFDQSDRLADYVRDLLAMNPQFAAAQLTRERVCLENGSRIEMLAQSQTAVRGQHVQKIRCDEADLFDSEIWRAVQFATRSQSGARGSIEVLSTLHRSGGLMQELVDQARQQRGTGVQCSMGILPMSSCSTGILPVSSVSSSSSFSSVSSLAEQQQQQQQQQQQRHGQDARATRGENEERHGQDAHATQGYRLIQWCLWEVIERCGLDRRCEDCPLAADCRGVARQADGFFSIDDAIAIRARSSRAAWESEMLCRGVRRDHLVLREFNPARHVGDVAYNRAWPLYRAMDFGFSSPMVCLWIQLTPAGCVHVLGEYVMERRAISQHAKAILAMDPGKPVAATYVDPAGRQKESTSGMACTELLHWQGIYCTSRYSTVAQGLELIRAALDPAEGPSTLKIAPRCRHLLHSLENYHYPLPDAPGARDKPVKDGPDHAIDALRYFFVNKMNPWGKTEMRYY